MRKLKKKYKWQNRESHLAKLRQDKILTELLTKNIGKLSAGEYWYVLNMRNSLPLSEKNFSAIINYVKLSIKNYNDRIFGGDIHWTNEEEQMSTTMAQNDLAGMPSSLVSALEKESVGTTIPTLKESFRTLDELPITLDLGE